MKVCCLIQATLGNINIEEWGLKQEANLVSESANSTLNINFVLQICTSANRLMRGMVHYLAERKYFSVLHSAVLLYFFLYYYLTTLTYSLCSEKCFKQHMWENSNLMLKQLEKIGNVLAKNLASNGVDTFEKLAATPPHLIDRVRYIIAFITSTNLYLSLLRVVFHSATMSNQALPHFPDTV